MKIDTWPCTSKYCLSSQKQLRLYRGAGLPIRLKGLNKNSPSQYPTIDIDRSSRINDDDDGDDDVGDVDDILAGEVRQLPDQVAEHMHWAGDSSKND